MASSCISKVSTTAQATELSNNRNRIGKRISVISGHIARPAEQVPGLIEGGRDGNGWVASGRPT
jgi:hypothetical protein